MAKSEAIKIAELELKKIRTQKQYDTVQLFIENVFKLMTSEIGLAVIGVWTASELGNHNKISSGARYALETASIAFPAIKAAAPIVKDVVGTIGDVAGGALKLRA